MTNLLTRTFLIPIVCCIGCHSNERPLVVEDTGPKNQRWELLYSLEEQKETVWDVEFSSDGKRLLTACLDGTAQVWDVESGNKLAVLKCCGHMTYHAMFSPDGKFILTSPTIQVWDATNYKLVKELLGARPRFSKNGEKLLMETRLGPGTGLMSFELVDWATFETIDTIDMSKNNTTFPWHDFGDLVNSYPRVCRSPDGKWLLKTVFGDSVDVGVYASSNTSVPLATLQGSGGVRKMIWSPDGKKVAIVGLGNSPRIWVRHESR